VVHSASIQDRVGAHAVLLRLFCRFDIISTVIVEAGYTGKLIDWASQMFDYEIEVVKRTHRTLSKCCPSAGSSNAPSLRSTGQDHSAKTMNSDIAPQKP
jgi:hypothetical protein